MMKSAALHDPVAHDIEVLLSMRLPNGLFRASATEDYEFAWFRDVIYACYGFMAAGKWDLVISTYHALMDVLHRQERKIDFLIWRGVREDWERIHPRYMIDGREVPGRWAWAQNDAFGLFLMELGRMYKQGRPVFRNENDAHLVQRLIMCLDRAQCWGPDNGMWEEFDGKVIRLSSIAPCLAGLEEWYGVTIGDNPVEIPDHMIDLCRGAIQRLGQNETPDRACDMAQLTLPWPIKWPRWDLLDQVAATLERDHGVIRWDGDYYHRGRTPAEWPLGLLFLSAGYLQKGDWSGAWHYYNKANSLRTAEGNYPESYQIGDTDASPCEHTPLTWPHSLSAYIGTHLAGGSYSIN